MSEWLKTVYSVASCIGLVCFIEEVLLPGAKCLLHKLKGEPCEDCKDEDN